MDFNYQAPNSQPEIKRPKSRGKKILILTIVLIVIAATGSIVANLVSNKMATQASESSLGTVLINIDDNSFNPETMNVKKGQTVTWTNTTEKIYDLSISEQKDAKDTIPQNTDNSVSPSETLSYTFDSSGEYSITADEGESQFNSTITVE